MHACRTREAASNLEHGSHQLTHKFETSKAALYQKSVRRSAPCVIDQIKLDVTLLCWKHAYLPYRFWINNQSRMYLLEGAGELHRQFTMVVGDVMVFAQKPDRTLVVAGRPATKVRKHGRGHGIMPCCRC